MTNSITFRFPPAKRARLRRKAKLLGKTESQFIREVLDREIDDRPMGVRLAKLRGVLSSKDLTEVNSFSETIKAHNWRP